MANFNAKLLVIITITSIGCAEIGHGPLSQSFVNFSGIWTEDHQDGSQYKYTPRSKQGRVNSSRKNLENILNS